MPKEKLDYHSIFYTGNVIKSLQPDNNKMAKEYATKNVGKCILEGC